MFHKVWNPTENDLKNFNLFFLVSIPAGMLLPLLLNIFIPSQIWYLLAILWLLLITVARITAGIRFSANTSLKKQATSSTFLGKLSKDNRKKFLMSACVYMPISYVLGTSAGLFIINLVTTLTTTKAILISLVCLSVFVYSLWNYYNKLILDNTVSRARLDILTFLIGIKSTYLLIESARRDRQTSDQRGDRGASPDR